VSDSAGNTYAQDTTGFGSGFGMAAFSTHNSLSVSSGGGWFKTTLSPTSQVDWGMYVIEAAPPSGHGAVDVYAAGATGTLGTPVAGPTPVVAGGAELLLGVGFFQSVGQNVITSGWTALGSDNFTAATTTFSINPCVQTPVAAVSTYTFNGETDTGAITASMALLVLYKISTQPAGGGAVAGLGAPDSGKSYYLGNAQLTTSLKTSTTYLALLTAIPTRADTGSTITEATYTGYARKSVATTDWGSPSSGAVANVNSVTFVACSGGSSTVVAWALVDAASNGNMLYWAPLPVARPSITITNGVTPTVFPGQLAVAEH
jgi:hypothetical protein